VSAPNKPPPSANLTDVFFLPLPLLRRCRCLFRRLAVASPLLLLFRCFLPCRCFCLAIAFVSRCHPEMVALCATRLGSRYNGPCRGICIFFFLFYVVIPKRAFSRPGEGRKLFSESRDLSSCANSASNVSSDSALRLRALILSAAKNLSSCANSALNASSDSADLSPARRHSERSEESLFVSSRRLAQNLPPLRHCASTSPPRVPHPFARFASGAKSARPALTNSRPLDFVFYFRRLFLGPS
jgi:hypothetical protein